VSDQSAFSFEDNQSSMRMSQKISNNGNSRLDNLSEEEDKLLLG